MHDAPAQEAEGGGRAGLVRTHAGPCALIVVVGLLVFGRALFFDFVNYDDWGLLVLHADTLANPLYAISSFWRDAFAMLGPEARGVFYRPVLMLAYGVEAQVMGANPFIYHLTNVLLHLVVSCLVYVFLSAFGVRRQLSVGLALVFLCHPAVVTVAAWIPGRNDALLTIWFIVGTLCMLSFMREGRNSSLAVAVLCYAGAVFTKESGGVLLGILGATALLESSGRPERRRPLLVAAGAAGVVTVLWAALRAFALGASPIGASRIVGNLDALIVYLGKTLLPVGLSVVPHPADSSLVPGIVASVLLLAAVGLTWRRLFGPPGLGLLWYGAALAPTLLVPAQTWGLEQRIYLPMVGMLLFVAWIPAPGGLALSPRVGPALAVAVAIVFGVQSARRLPELADGTAFWESAVATSPSSALAPRARPRRRGDVSAARDRGGQRWRSKRCGGSLPACGGTRAQQCRRLGEPGKAPEAAAQVEGEQGVPPQGRGASRSLEAIS
jgi:hypothetical protein